MATQKIDKRILLVAGYVKEISEQYKIKNIPLEINDMIYLYQRLCDEWSQKYKTDNISVDTANAMITADDKERIKILGSHIVSEGVFTWKIKMISFTYTSEHGGPPFVGIVEDDADWLDEFFQGENQDNTFWYRRGYQYCCKTGDRFSQNGYDSSGYGTGWKNDGEILEMTLDLNHGTLCFKVNDMDHGVAFENIKPKNWRLAFSTFESKESKFMLLG